MEQKRFEVEGLMRRIEIKQLEIRLQREQIASESAAAERQDIEVAEEAAACQAHVDKTLPMLDDAIAALQTLKKRDLDEVSTAGCLGVFAFMI
jgi:hypothetical protein